MTFYNVQINLFAAHPAGNSKSNSGFGPTSPRICLDLSGLVVTGDLIGLADCGDLIGYAWYFDGISWLPLDKN